MRTPSRIGSASAPMDFGLRRNAVFRPFALISGGHDKTQTHMAGLESLNFPSASMASVDTWKG